MASALAALAFAGRLTWRHLKGNAVMFSRNTLSLALLATMTMTGAAARAGGVEAMALTKCPSGTTLACQEPPDPSEVPGTKNPHPTCKCEAPAPPPPVSPRNRNHFSLLDATHDVVTALGTTWTPVTTTPDAVDCTPIYGQGDGSYVELCMVGQGVTDFSADMGGGVELDAVDSVQAMQPTAGDPQIQHILFDSSIPAGSPFLHLTGFLDMPNDSTVTATVNVTIGPDALPAGGLVLALQTQDAANNWNDVAVYSSPAINTLGATENITLKVAGTVTTQTAVRAELRKAAWKGGVSLTSAMLLVPECLPDMSNPGTCLP